MTRATSVFAVLIFSAAVSSGAITTYTDRTIWTANVQNETTVTFDSASAGYTPPATNNYLYLGYSPLTISGIQFTSYADGRSSTQYVYNYTSGTNNWNSGAILTGTSTVSGHTYNFHVVLPTGTKAFGVDLMLINLVGQYTINLDGVTAGSVTTALNPTRTFFGVTSDNSIGAVDLITTVGNITPALDNFSIGTPGSATPESQTFLLCGVGLLAIGQVRKRFSV